MRVEYIVTILTLISIMPALAQNSKVCPPVQNIDNTYSAGLDIHLILPKKLLSAGVELTPTWKEEKKTVAPGSEEHFNLILFSSVCNAIMDRTDLKQEQKQENLEQWVLTYIGTPTEQKPTDPALQVVSLTSSTSASQTQHNVDTLIVHPPSTAPPKNSIVLKVFMKSNIQALGVAALQAALPTYNVRIGSSTINPTKTADVLFVNRATISKDDIIQVLTALQKIGVYIKSIQQPSFLGDRREMQVGTSLLADGDTQEFANATPLDINVLKSLDGSNFWIASFNGQVDCNDQAGLSEPTCHISAEGRPVP